MKKKLIVILILASILMLSSCSNSNGAVKETNGEKLKIVSTIFPGYDLAKQIGGDKVEVELLIAPGAEIHSFEPTAKQIQEMKESDVIILIGSPHETWAKRFLEDNSETDTKIIRLVDVLGEEHEEDSHSEEHEHEENHIHLVDEHVWTSPKNMIALSDQVYEAFAERDSESSKYFEDRKDKFISELEKLDSDFRELVSSAKRKVIVVADRFPFKYFVEEYGLEYYAAFESCSHETQESAKTVSDMIAKVKEHKIPYIYKIELSNGNIADVVSQSTGAEILELHSAQNITKEEFDDGITYIQIMNNNLETLKRGLN